MNDTYELRGGETHIEVHKFYPGAIIITTFVAFVLQTVVPVYVPKFSVLDLPLLLTIYFGLSRRNPSTGLLLGTMIGWIQDSLSGPTVPFGVYGISKTVVGYLASSIGARLDTEHPAARFFLVALFYGVQHVVLVLTHRLLLAQTDPWFSLQVGIAAAVNAFLGTLLFMALDRLRR